MPVNNANCEPIIEALARCFDMYNPFAKAVCISVNSALLAACVAAGG